MDGSSVAISSSSTTPPPSTSGTIDDNSSGSAPGATNSSVTTTSTIASVGDHSLTGDQQQQQHQPNLFYSTESIKQPELVVNTMASIDQTTDANHGDTGKALESSIDQLASFSAPADSMSANSNDNDHNTGASTSEEIGTNNISSSSATLSFEKEVVSQASGIVKESSAIVGDSNTIDSADQLNALAGKDDIREASNEDTDKALQSSIYQPIDQSNLPGHDGDRGSGNSKLGEATTTADDKEAEALSDKQNNSTVNSSGNSYIEQFDERSRAQLAEKEEDIASPSSSSKGQESEADRNEQATAVTFSPTGTASAAAVSSSSTNEEHSFSLNNTADINTPELLIWNSDVSGAAAAATSSVLESTPIESIDTTEVVVTSQDSSSIITTTEQEDYQRGTKSKDTCDGNFNVFGSANEYNFTDKKIRTEGDKKCESLEKQEGENGKTLSQEENVDSALNTTTAQSYNVDSSPSFYQNQLQFEISQDCAKDEESELIIDDSEISSKQSAPSSPVSPASPKKDSNSALEPLNSDNSLVKPSSPSASSMPYNTLFEQLDCAKKLENGEKPLLAYHYVGTGGQDTAALGMQDIKKDNLINSISPSSGGNNQQAAPGAQGTEANNTGSGGVMYSLNAPTAAINGSQATANGSNTIITTSINNNNNNASPTSLSISSPPANITTTNGNNLMLNYSNGGSTSIATTSPTGGNNVNNNITSATTTSGVGVVGSVVGCNETSIAGTGANNNSNTITTTTTNSSIITNDSVVLLNGEQQANVSCGGGNNNNNTNASVLQVVASSVSDTHHHQLQLLHHQQQQQQQQSPNPSSTTQFVNSLQLPSSNNTTATNNNNGGDTMAIASSILAPTSSSATTTTLLLNSSASTNLTTITSATPATAVAATTVQVNQSLTNNTNNDQMQIRDYLSEINVLQPVSTTLPNGGNVVDLATLQHHQQQQQQQQQQQSNNATTTNTILTNSVGNFITTHDQQQQLLKNGGAGTILVDQNGHPIDPNSFNSNYLYSTVQLQLAPTGEVQRALDSNNKTEGASTATPIFATLDASSLVQQQQQQQSISQVSTTSSPQQVSPATSTHSAPRRGRGRPKKYSDPLSLAVEQCLENSNSPTGSSTPQGVTTFGGPYNCRSAGCTFVTNDVLEFRNHNKAKHRDESTIIPSRKGAKGQAILKEPLVCEVPGCGYSPKYRRLLIDHQNAHKGLRAHKCCFCEYNSSYFGDIRKHMIKKHPDLAQEIKNCKIKLKQKVLEAKGEKLSKAELDQLSHEMAAQSIKARQGGDDAGPSGSPGKRRSYKRKRPKKGEKDDDDVSTSGDQNVTQQLSTVSTSQAYAALTANEPKATILSNLSLSGQQAQVTQQAPQYSFMTAAPGYGLQPADLTGQATGHLTTANYGTLNTNQLMQPAIIYLAGSNGNVQLATAATNEMGHLNQIFNYDMNGQLVAMPAGQSLQNLSVSNFATGQPTAICLDGSATTSGGQVTFVTDQNGQTYQQVATQGGVPQVQMYKCDMCNFASDHIDQVMIHKHTEHSMQQQQQIAIIDASTLASMQAQQQQVHVSQDQHHHHQQQQQQHQQQQLYTLAPTSTVGVSSANFVHTLDYASLATATAGGSNVVAATSTAGGGQLANMIFTGDPNALYFNAAQLEQSATIDGNGLVTITAAPGGGAQTSLVATAVATAGLADGNSNVAISSS